MNDHHPIGAKTIQIPAVQMTPEGVLSCDKCSQIFYTDGTAFTIGALHTIARTHICPDGDTNGSPLPI